MNISRVKIFLRVNKFSGIKKSQEICNVDSQKKAFFQSPRKLMILDIIISIFVWDVNRGYKIILFNELLL